MRHSEGIIQPIHAIDSKIHL
ncbi:hypothetical protein F383_34637 [Gossypium arboreum]|uniref:Uncharacterized protein n=1 Tax=Gossypium arboreum TaxID=29729 RepID=A0A0B0N7V3_GOSAR|nr:hypothetical protein F383_34637 [Gossypium arboreum]